MMVCMVEDMYLPSSCSLFMSPFLGATEDPQLCDHDLHPKPTVVYQDFSGYLIFVDCRLAKQILISMIIVSLEDNALD